MKNWDLLAGDPGSFSIAADARFVRTSYVNDHIWVLSLKGGEPPALSIQTTFGLRAKSLRLFPRFVEGDTAYVNPLGFISQARVQRFYPNYLKVSYAPLEGIDVSSEYWVPTSNTLMGRVRIANNRLINRRFTFQWTALLSPNQGGQRMAPKDLDSTTILAGQTSNLCPILYISGTPHASSGPYPALSLDFDLPPGDVREVTWAHVASETVAGSYKIAQEITAKHWDAEIARVEVINSSTVAIETGDKDWNAAFALAQKNAINLLVGPTEQLPHLSFVEKREPDQGFSSLGNGLDYIDHWKGQTPLETDFLSTFLLPSSPEIAKGLLMNFLSTQTSQGFISYRVGLGGQRENILATPILVNLAWRIYRVTEDLTFLETVFPKLLQFIQAWFTESQDRDGDGLPEWERASQSGYEDNPLFSSWESESLASDISKTESPSLCSFLYNEIRILMVMADKLGQTSPIAALEGLAENLKAAVKTSWNDSDQIYLNWDRESHFPSRGEILGKRIGPGEILVNKDFTPPVRLVFKLIANGELPKELMIFIHGTGKSGNQRIEKIGANQIYWRLRHGNVTSERIYSGIEHIEIGGINSEDRIIVGVMDLSNMDHTLLLPLWAEIPDEEKASKLINNTIRNPDRFGKPFGMPASAFKGKAENQATSLAHMIWNNLIGEALLKYGFRSEVADLMTRLMNAIIKNLKDSRSFYSYYNAATGLGYGDRNAIKGLAPVGLFLKALGIHIISASKVVLEGKNHFPWPVTVRYQGLSILRESQRTVVSFPGGQTAVVKSEEPKIIQVSSGEG